MNPDLYDEVRRAGQSTARRWAGVIDADDAEQEIWVRLLESDYVERVSEMEPGARAHVLGRIGSQVASGYRDDYEAFSGNVVYGTEDVSRMLKSGLLEKQRRKLDPSSETLTGFLDLHEGCQALRDRTPRYAETIAKAFLLDEDTGHPMNKMRAVDALTKEMNRANARRYAAYEEGPGSRKAMPNSTAQAITGHQWDGGG